MALGTIVAQYVGYFYFAYQTVTGRFTLGDMVMFFTAFYRAQSYLRLLLGGITGLYESNLFLQDMDSLMKLAPKVVSPEKPERVPAKPTPIEFLGVSFSYPGGERAALTDVSLRIEPGQHVAVVGRNGSGKSTLVKLLCRLYDCSEGRIELGGRDIRDYDLESVRQQFSVLFQDYLQFDLPVRKNIWLGDIRRDPEDEGVARAASLSGAEEVIETLPKGFDTMLGRHYEDGEQLSQGEWQKVALARALFREAPVTVLDEPTSWMDPESEYRFFREFDRMSRGRTAIMISHRLSTVRMADQIVVLEAGRLIETGTHEELMQKGARYAELFETQAADYR